MATTAGAVSKLSSSQSAISVSSAVASGGATTPYTYQWYRSTVSGFTPGTGSIVAGATALLLADTGLSPGTQYFYKMVATDSSSPTVSGTSAQLLAATLAALQNPNQFVQAPVLGQVDLYLNYNTIACQVDASQGATPLVAGQAVKVVASEGGIPKIIACSANADNVFGFINYNVKNRNFGIGFVVEVSQKGNVLYLQSTGPIARGAQVTLDLFSIGGVGQLVGSSGANIVGFALDNANGGELVRIELIVPSFASA